MGTGSSGKISASALLGKNSAVPTSDDIKMGTGEYAGMPVRYAPEQNAEASNHDTFISVSDKFFALSTEQQMAVLNHEVAHNFSEYMQKEYASEVFDQKANLFIQKKDVPKGSVAWQNGQRTYYEGLYGDIGASAISETTTKAIHEYLENPGALRKRSAKAYKFVDRVMRRYLRQHGAKIPFGEL